MFLCLKHLKTTSYFQENVIFISIIYNQKHYTGHMENMFKSMCAEFTPLPSDSEAKKQLHLTLPIYLEPEEGKKITLWFIIAKVQEFHK